jgi:hypothetical protein
MSIRDELKTQARMLAVPAVVVAGIGLRYLLVHLGVELRTAKRAQVIFLGVAFLCHLIFMISQAVRKSNRSGGSEV